MVTPSMASSQKFKYRNITVSGKIATGTSTLAKNLKEALGWEYMNTGALQRKYDRAHGVNENEHGATLRPDEHERETEAFAKKTLAEKNNIVYEAWLSGFVAREMKDVLKILVVCSADSIRIDRVANRDKVSIEEAKRYMHTREQENIAKWKALYGDYNFWDPKYYDVVIDTFSSGQMETLGKALDKLGFVSKI